MVYDKRKEFKKLDETLLKDIRIACNRLQIPFFWIAPVYDDGKGTQYKIGLDTNEEVSENKQYVCNGLVPGSMGVHLTDDLIKNIIKVINGFKVVMNDDRLVMRAADFAPSSLLSGSNGEYEEGGVFYMNDDFEEEEKAMENNIPPMNTEEGSFIEAVTAKRDVIEQVSEIDHFGIRIERNTSLPYIKEDYDEDEESEEEEEKEKEEKKTEKKTEE